MMRNTILNIESVATGYKSGKNKKVISEKLSSEISNGRLVALLGPNGCGKSTLLRTIAGLQPALSGGIKISKKNIEQLKGKQKARLLSLVLTDKVASAHLIVKDIVAIGRYPYTGPMGVLKEEDKAIIDKAVAQCNLSSYTERTYAELSDGEKQRVMIARALAQDTPLMMLDEPTAHLDLPNRIELMKMLRDLARETQKAILLSTHELDLALQWCDYIWLMNEKGEMETGTPEDLVLNNVFSSVFSNHSFFFDLKAGMFKIRREPHGRVFLSGDKIVQVWTKRALERNGFEIVSENENIDFSIEARASRQWELKIGKDESIHYSIENLLDKLVKIKSIG